MPELPEWLLTIRGAIAYALHVPLHWLSFALLPYAGDWTYRHERRDYRRKLAEAPIARTIVAGGRHPAEPEDHSPIFRRVALLPFASEDQQ